MKFKHRITSSLKLAFERLQYLAGVHFRYLDRRVMVWTGDDLADDEGWYTYPYTTWEEKLGLLIEYLRAQEFTPEEIAHIASFEPKKDRDGTYLIKDRGWQSLLIAWVVRAAYPESSIGLMRWLL